MIATSICSNSTNLAEKLNSSPSSSSPSSSSSSSSPLSTEYNNIFANKQNYFNNNNNTTDPSKSGFYIWKKNDTQNKMSSFGSLIPSPAYVNNSLIEYANLAQKPNSVNSSSSSPLSMSSPNNPSQQYSLNLPSKFQLSSLISEPIMNFLKIAKFWGKIDYFFSLHV